MSPDPGIRLQSVIRSLEQIVLPSIDPQHSLAREQAAIAIGHLEMLRMQWPYMERYASLCLDDMRRFATAILECANGLHLSDPAIDTLRSLMVASADPPPFSARDVWMVRNRIAAAIDAIVFAVAEAPSPQHRAIEAIVLEHALHEHGRDRAWFARTGLDLEADGQKPLGEIFRAVARA